jgi:peptidoglycan/LPS O-acetylase OafA/YrhL
MVVVHHCTLGPTPLPIVTPLAKLGYVGVTFFFVLSGFVLAWSGTPDLPARYFYGRRFARIYPTHGVTILAALLLSAVVGLTTGVGPLVTSVWLTQAWVPISPYTEQLNNVSWSLAPGNCWKPALQVPCVPGR